MHGYQQQHNAIGHLHADLNLLLIRHGDFLRRESLARDVQSLADWVEDYMRGSPEASNYLHGHGHTLLSEINGSLFNSIKELQHGYDDTVEYGVLTHRLRDAGMIAERAMTHFEDAIVRKPAVTQQAA